MTTKAAKATRAKRLRESEVFMEFHQEVMGEQVAVFSNPDASPDEIAESHAIVRALQKIVGRMRAAEFDHSLQQKRAKKGQHRGND